MSVIVIIIIDAAPVTIKPMGRLLGVHTFLKWDHCYFVMPVDYLDTDLSLQSHKHTAFKPISHTFGQIHVVTNGH